MGKKRNVEVIARNSNFTTIKTERGTFDLETEQGRRNRYFEELKAGIGMTKGGELVDLSPEGRAFRAGYLEAQNRSAKIFKKKNPGYVAKKKS